MGIKKDKSDFLVQGTILAGASVIARIIGMVYRIPLTRILGDEGVAYYSTANEIYMILLLISTNSLPLAISKMMSEKIQLGQMKNAQKIFSCSMKFALLSGGVVSVFTFLLAGVLAGNIMKVDNAVNALRVLAPAIFLFAVAGVFRGFFQGMGNMIPTAVSQVIEQIVNAVVSVGGAALMFHYGTSVANGDNSVAPTLGATGAMFGKIASILIALLFLAAIYLSYQKTFKRAVRHDTAKKMDSDRAIYTTILITIIPVIFSTLIYNISPTLDQGIFNHILSGQGYTSEQYNTIYGIYLGKFRVLMNVPLSLASCLAPSVVPTLSAAMAEGNLRDARLKVRHTMRYTMILTIPCAVGMASLAGPIMWLVMNDRHALSAGIMQAGALMIVLFAISTLSTAVLQGIGRMREPLVNSGISLVVHVAVLLVLLKQFRLNIYGVVYANTLFALMLCILNGISIRRYLRYRQELRKTFLIPLISSAFMGIAAYAVYQAVNALMRILFIDAASNAVAVLLAVLAGMAVYLFLLIRLRGIRQSEIRNLPKGDLWVGILKKMHFL